MNVRTISTKEPLQRCMQDSSFQILFLGEDLAWSRISSTLTDAVRSQLKIHRAQSLNELFLVLAGGQWHAAVVDIQAWNYQGLHYVEKIHSEYPSLPILALHTSADIALSRKAKNSGATHSLYLEDVTADTIHLALLSGLSEKKSQSRLRKASSVQLTFNIPDSVSDATSKNQVLSHALNNLLCVITANADMLAEQVGASGPGGHSLSEIKRAAKSASDLMRLIK